MNQSMSELKENKIEEKVRRIADENFYIGFLGIEFLELKEDYGLARMKYKEELLNPYGILHGGSLYSFADIVAGTVGCMSGYFMTTVSGNMSFLLPAGQTEYVYCEVERLRMGKHLAVFTVKIKNDEDQVLDSGEFTFFVTEQKVV